MSEWNLTIQKLLNEQEAEKPSKVHVSKFWKTIDFEEGHPVWIRRLGDGCPGEYRGVIRGKYACDVDGHPDCYIVEMLDKLVDAQGYGYSCSVFPRGCVDSKVDLTLKDERFIENV